MWSRDVYERALAFAQRAHAGQFVPGTELPYVHHVVNVAAQVIESIEAEPLDAPDLAIQAALLHDTVEDTSVTLDELQKRFGPYVAAGVAALTKAPELSKPEAMADSLRRIQEQPMEIWRVKLADRIVNLAPPPSYWSPEKCRAYHTEAGLILDALNAASQLLASRLEERRDLYLVYCR